MKLTSADQDEVTIIYDISYPDDKVVINFEFVNDLKLGNKNKLSYGKLQDKSCVKVIFLDGTNFDDNTIVESENYVDFTSFTTPDGWQYHPQSKSGKDQVFCLNVMTEHPKLIFSGQRDKQKLILPIYLAYTTEKKNRNIFGQTKSITTTYHVFSTFDPLMIELSNKQVVPANHSKNGEIATETVELKFNEDEVVLDDVPNESELPSDGQGSDSSGGGGTSNDISSQENDAIVIQELKDLKVRLDSCKKSSEIDNVENLYQNLNQNFGGKVSSAVQKQITDFAKAIVDKREEIKPNEEKWKWIKIILGAIGALLAALGFHKLKDISNQKNLKGLEAMQQKMVRRAENEAKRRAQSMARNKAHQMVGQAKRKGRQAVRSGVTQLGDNVKGKKPVSIGTNASSSNAQNAANRPSVAQRPSAANNPNTRRPKTGNKGEISI